MKLSKAQSHKIRIIFFFILIFSNLHPTLSQNSSENFHYYLSKVATNLDSSTYFLQKATPLAKSPKQIVTLNKEWAWYYIDINVLDSAAFWISKNLGKQKESSDSVFLRRVIESYEVSRIIYMKKGDFIEGINQLIEALKIMENNSITEFRLSQCYLNIGIDYWRLYKYEDSDKWLKKGLVIAEKYGHDVNELQMLLMMGLLYESQDKLSLAKEHFIFVFQLIGENIDQHGRDYMATCDNIATVFKKENAFDSAIYYYQEALSMLDNNRIEAVYKNMIPYYRGSVLHNLGETYSLNKDYHNSVFYHKKALESKIQLGESHPELIRTYGSIGKSYSLLGEFEKAEHYFTNALQISKENDTEIPKCYNYLGDFYAQSNSSDHAMLYYDSAIQYNPYSELDGIKLYTYPIDQLYSLEGKCRIEFSKDNVNLDEVEGLYLEVKSLLKFFYGKTDNSSIFESIQPLLGNFYQAYSSAYERTNDEKWLERIWGISQIHKSIKLRLELNDKSSLSYSISEELLSREQELKDSLNSRLKEIEPGKFDSALFVLKKEYNLFIENLEQDFPKYHALKYDFNTINLAQLRDQLGKKEAFYNFFVGKEDVFFLRATRKKITINKVPKDDLFFWIGEMNESILDPSEVRLLEVSEKIAQALLLSPDHLKEIEKLTIIPDGVIWKLNFTALASKSGEALSYLGNDLAISYDYYSNNEPSKPFQGKNRVLAFSYGSESEEENTNAYFAFRDLDDKLPGTSKEVTAISNHWPGDYYYSSLANESAFKEKSKDYGILHLAVHGFLDEINPENSYLKFESADSLNDGRLYSYEIYNLDLNAELAVLSACQSGQGELVTGEGIMSLGRSFSYAGVQSLVASRWEVSDLSAPYLMQYFYEGLKHEMRKSEALRYAQSNYLKNDADKITSAPFYWAGFYIIGNDEPISQTESKNWMWWLLVPVGLIGFVIVRKRQLVQ